MPKNIKVLTSKEEAEFLHKLAADAHLQELTRYKKLISHLIKKNMEHASTAILAKEVNRLKATKRKIIKVAKAEAQLINAKSEGEYSDADKKELTKLAQQIKDAQKILDLLERKEAVLQKMKKLAYKYYFAAKEIDAQWIFTRTIGNSDIDIGKYGKYSDVYHEEREDILYEDHENDQLIKDMDQKKLKQSPSLSTPGVNIIIEPTTKKDSIDIPLDNDNHTVEEAVAHEDKNTTPEDNASAESETTAPEDDASAESETTAPEDDVSAKDETDASEDGVSTENETAVLEDDTVPENKTAASEDGAEDFFPWKPLFQE